MKNIMLTEDKELNLRYERYRTILENLTIMDDIFMRNVLKSVECTEYILQVIMENHDLQVVDQTLQKDVLGHGLPIYHIERKIAEVNENFRDESHIIYVNTKAKEQENTELGRLLHDLNCKSADDMYSEVLAKRVSELKETQEGV